MDNSFFRILMGVKWLVVAIVVYFLFLYFIPLSYANHPQFMHIIGAILVSVFVFLGARDLSRLLSPKDGGRSSNLTFFLPLVSLILCGFLFGSCFDSRVISELKEKGIITQAKIKSGRSHSWQVIRGIAGDSYHLFFTITDSDGKEKEVRADVGSEEFNSLAEGNMVKIIYLPDDNSICRFLIGKNARVFNMSENRDFSYEDIVALMTEDPDFDTWEYLQQCNSGWLRSEGEEGTEYIHKAKNETLYISRGRNMITYSNNEHALSRPYPKAFIPSGSVVDSIQPEDSKQKLYLTKDNIAFIFRREYDDMRIVPLLTFYKE